MSDLVYQTKYADGAEKTEPLKKIKQASDARFLKGVNGGYFGGGATYRPRGGGGGTLEIGSEDYTTSYLTHRIALMATGGWDQWSVGLDGGLRLQTPTRLAPFVGVGGFAGPNWVYEDVSDDGRDNDDDGSIDERGEDDWDVDAVFVAAYPEVGIHFWWTPELRLTGYGRYWITSDGRASDDWLIGGNLAVFSR